MSAWGQCNGCAPGRLTFYHPDVISRRTLYTLLLTLLLAASVRLWAACQRDDCDRLGPGTRGTPSSVLVESGTRTITVPCTYWVPRQPVRVQLLVLLNLVLGLVFVVSVGTDWARARARRRALVQSTSAGPLN